MTLTEFLTARLDEDEATARDERVEDIPGDCWGPKRILREIEAKRAVVQRAALDWETKTGVPAADAGLAAGLAVYHSVLRDLAAVYSDHPDYDEAWRP